MPFTKPKPLFLLYRSSSSRSKTGRKKGKKGKETLIVLACFSFPSNKREMMMMKEMKVHQKPTSP